MKRLICMLLVIALVTVTCGAYAVSTMTLPAQLNEISDEAFMGDTSLDKVTLPDGTMTIGERAYANSSLRRIWIPNSINYIADDAFEGVSGLTIESRRYTYAYYYALNHGIAWADPERAERQDFIDRLEEEPEDQEPIDLEGMEFPMMSTNGVTDATLLSCINDYNAAQAQLQSDVAEMITAKDALEEPLNGLCTTANTYMQGITEDGIAFDGLVYSIGMDALDSLTGDLALTAAYPDPIEGGMLLEADDDSRTVYLRWGPDGVETIGAREAKEIKESAYTIVPRDAVIEAAQNSLENALSFGEQIVSDIGNWTDTISQMIDDAYEKALKSQRSAELVVQEYDRVANRLEFLEEPVSDVRARHYTRAAKNLESLNKAVGLLKWAKTLWSTFDIGTSVWAITQDIQMCREYYGIFDHGHPTVEELAIPERLRQVDRLESDEVQFAAAITGHLVFNILELVTGLNNMLTPLKAATGPLGITVGAIAAVSTTIAKKILKNVLIEVLASTGLDAARDAAYENMCDSHDALHNPLPDEPAPTPTPTPTQGQVNPDPTPEVIPGPKSTSDPFYGSGSIALNSASFPEPCILSWASMYDYDNDGVLSLEERKDMTYFHHGSDQGEMHSLVGLKAFPNLDTISIYSYDSDTLNFEDYPNLKYVYIGNLDELREISVRDCPKLRELYWRYSRYLENCYVWDCPSLEKIKMVDSSADLDDDNVENLSVVRCPAIKSIEVYCCGMNSLTLIGCPNLESLDLYGNNLTSLDLSGLSNLVYVSLQKNEDLVSLDLEGCDALATLYLTGANIRSLDVSGKQNLKNLALGLHETVDASNCTMLKSLTLSSGGKGVLRELDVSGDTSLQSMGNMNYGVLTSLNFSGCTSLKSLKCYGNALTRLDISDCISLLSLDCSDNQLTELDVSGCTALEDLNCYSNALTRLNISDCISLLYLSCSNNQLTELDVSGAPELEKLKCNGNMLERLDLKNMTSLRLLWCNDNSLTVLKIYGCSKLVDLNLRTNKVRVLNIRGCNWLKVGGISCDEDVTICN